MAGQKPLAESIKGIFFFFLSLSKDSLCERHRKQALEKHSQLLCSMRPDVFAASERSAWPGLIKDGKILLSPLP